MNEHVDPVIVLGMHRSGTSALAGCLHLLDVNLGQNLISQSESERLPGYYVNSDIVLIHDIFLRDLGCRWDMIGPLPENWLDSKASDKAREKILNLIERDFSMQKLWAISDPRLCRLLPLWIDIFKNKGLSPRIIFIVRHPYEVAFSLKTSCGFDLLKGHLLWFACNRQAFSELENQSHVILTYEQLLADPVTCLRAISSELDINFPKNIDGVYQDIITFIRPGLKHENPTGAHFRQKEKETFSHFVGLYDQFKIFQPRQIDSSGKDHNATESDFSETTTNLGMPVFSLLTSQPEAYRRTINTFHTYEMFDNLLNFISFYEQAELDREIKRQRLLLEADHQEPMLYAQIFLPGEDKENAYTEDNSKKFLLAPEEWQKISIDISNPDIFCHKQLRFDPLNVKGIIKLQSLSLINSATDQPVWSVSGSATNDQCTVEGQAFILDQQDKLLICATGDDPRIFLPVIPNLPDVPLRFEAWLKVNRDLNELADIWKEKEKTIQDLEKDKLEEKSRFDQLNLKYEQALAEWEKTKLQFEKSIRNSEKDQLEEKSRFNQLNLKHEQALAEWEKTKLQFENSIVGLQNNYQEKLSAKQNDIENLQQELQQLRKKSANQENLTRHYFAELSKTESQLVKIQDLANDIDDQRLETEKWIQEIYKDYQALISSARWRLGNGLVRGLEIILFRKKQPLAVDHIQQIFLQYKKKEKNSTPSESFFLTDSYDIERLNRYLHQLNKDYDLLRSSMRWKLGNAIVRTLEIIAFRPKQTMAIDHLGEIFKEYQKQSSGHADSSPKALQTWLRHVKNDFHALKNSMRWRVGNRIFAIIDLMLFRLNKPTAMDHAQKILSEFDDWQKSYP